MLMEVALSDGLIPTTVPGSSNKIHVIYHIYGHYKALIYLPSNPS